MNRPLLCALFASSLLWSGLAFAAAPTTSLLDGVLTSSGGSAAADGDYDITFTIYDAASGGAKVWSEGPVKVKVAGGRFSHVLGSATALDMAKLVAAKGQWLALKVGSDPELPAQSLHASVFALHAGTAAVRRTCSSWSTARTRPTRTISTRPRATSGTKPSSSSTVR